MADSSSGEVVETKRHSILVATGIRLVKEKPLGTVGAVITLLFLLTGIFANFLAPYGMNECSVDILAPSSTTHLLGTDHLGRDVLSRVIFGARISVIVGLTAAGLAVIVSLLIGIPSGYFGGKLDLILQRFVDAWMFFPMLLILMVLMSIVGYGMLPIIIIIAVGMGIPGSRIIRGAVMTTKENVYILAAEATGCSTARIFIRHILPNVMAPVITLFSIRVPNAILTEASMSFLGFGIPPPAPSWGGMLTGGERYNVFIGPWIVIWPGVALSTVVYGVNMFGDALRDLLDPRLRGGVGRYGVRVKKEAVTKSEPNAPEGLTKQ